jgi:hypothetical protein
MAMAKRKTGALRNTAGKPGDTTPDTDISKHKTPDEKEK